MIQCNTTQPITELLPSATERLTADYGQISQQHNESLKWETIVFIPLLKLFTYETHFLEKNTSDYSNKIEPSKPFHQKPSDLERGVSFLAHSRAFPFCTAISCISLKFLAGNITERRNIKYSSLQVPMLI